MKKTLYPKRLVMLVALTGLATVQFWATTYSRPASYTASAAYRTNKPEQKAVEIVNNQRLDSVRRSSPQDYIRRVCSEISSHTSNEFLRVKLIHDVTALLLFYDDSSYWSNSVPQQTLSHILQTRKAVCEGYANLFLALCDGIGLPCEKIHGYARGVGASEQGTEDPTNSNHAWNMVRIQGAWYLVDCTWDSGYMNGRTSVQDYNTTWLFVQPDQMIYTHFPSQQSHQLLDYPLTPQEFTRLPSLRPNLFDSATLQELPSRSNQVGAVSIINYQLQPGSRLSFQIQDISTGKTISKTVFYEANSQTGVTTAFLVPPQPGTYKVQIFSWKKEGKNGEGCGHFFITTTASRPGHINLSTAEGRQELLSKGGYSSFSKKDSPQAIAKARTTPQGNSTAPSPSTYSARRPDFSGFLNSQENAPMGGIFVGGGNLLQAKEMKERHNLSVGFLLPSFWLGDWGNVFYWGGRVEIQGSILGEKTMDFTFLSGITLTLWRFQPYIEGGFGLRNGNWKPTLEVSPGIDFSFTKQSPLAFGVFYRFQWHSDWKAIIGKNEYLGARILFRPHNFKLPSLSQPDFGGDHVISLGYIFPTDLAKDRDFSAGSRDSFGLSVSWEEANKLFPLIVSLSYRKRQVQEEGGSHQTAATGYGPYQVQEARTLTDHTLMLEGSLGFQLFPSFACYAGAGIGLSLIPENNVVQEGEDRLVQELDWQVQGGVRLKLLDLIYTRAQVAYSHTGEINLSLHLGFALF